MAAIGLLRDDNQYAGHLTPAPRNILAVALLEVLTWVFLVGSINSLSTYGVGDNALTIAVALSGAAVSLLRRVGRLRLTWAAFGVELLTLLLVVAMLNNPDVRGRDAVLVALIAWAGIIGLRHVIRRERTLLTNTGYFGILLLAAVLIDGRTYQGIATLFIVGAWLALEAAWLVLDQRLFRNARLPFTVTTTQKRAMIVASIALVAMLVAGAVRNLTTLQYYDQTISVFERASLEKPLYCAQEAWIFAGIDLSFAGFNGMRCYDTRAEVDAVIQGRIR